MSTFIIVGLALSAAFMAFGALSTVSNVGKRRDPITGRVAAATVVVAAYMITVFILAATRLHW